MSEKNISAINRRDFIRRAACAAVGTVAMTSAIRDLRFMNAAIADQTIPADYKAMVCIFLSGGNDSNNLIIPTITSEYNNYANIRGSNLALPISGAPANVIPIPLSPIISDTHSYGLHPACKELADMFNGTGSTTGKLAILFNAGTLIYPITKAQYSDTTKRPPQLFSHADQVTQWQTSIPDQPPVTGWGGRCADLLNAANTSNTVSLSVSIAGANTFEIGNAVSQYAVSTSGAIAMQGVTGNRLAALTNILGLPYPNMQANAYAGVANHSIATGALLNTAIANTADISSSQQFWTTPFPGSGTFQVITPTSGVKFNSSLGPQLKMIARMIEAGHRSALAGGFGMKRQIFFCSVGGFDLHSGQTNYSATDTASNNLVNVASGAHANLLAELSQSLKAFQAAMDQIGSPSMHNDPAFSQRVTAFTASDFGRTFPTNGVGSDHGWGSHHLICGGAVNGRQTYGKFPTLTVNGPDDTSTGRWIPTTATDQYFATLASWFGVDSGNLSTVFPNIGRFLTPNLGFV